MGSNYFTSFFPQAISKVNEDKFVIVCPIFSYHPQIKSVGRVSFLVKYEKTDHLETEKFYDEVIMSKKINSTCTEVNRSYKFWRLFRWKGRNWYEIEEVSRKRECFRFVILFFV